MVIIQKVMFLLYTNLSKNGLSESVDIADGDYLKFSDVANPNEIAERCLEVIETKVYLNLAEKYHEMTKKFLMKNYLEELLDETLASI